MPKPDVLNPTAEPLALAMVSERSGEYVIIHAHVTRQEHNGTGQGPKSLQGWDAPLLSFRVRAQSDAKSKAFYGLEIQCSDGIRLSELPAVAAHGRTIQRRIDALRRAEGEPADFAEGVVRIMRSMRINTLCYSVQGSRTWTTSRDIETVRVVLGIMETGLCDRSDRAVG